MLSLTARSAPSSTRYGSRLVGSEPSAIVISPPLTVPLVPGVLPPVLAAVVVALPCALVLLLDLLSLPHAAATRLKASSEPSNRNRFFTFSPLCMVDPLSIAYFIQSTHRLGQCPDQGFTGR